MAVVVADCAVVDDPLDVAETSVREADGVELVGSSAPMPVEVGTELVGSPDPVAVEVATVVGVPAEEESFVDT